MKPSSLTPDEYSFVERGSGPELFFTLGCVASLFDFGSEARSDAFLCKQQGKKQLWLQRCRLHIFTEPFNPIIHNNLPWVFCKLFHLLEKYKRTPNQ